MCIFIIDKITIMVYNVTNAGDASTYVRENIMRESRARGVVRMNHVRTEEVPVMVPNLRYTLTKRPTNDALRDQVGKLTPFVAEVTLEGGHVFQLIVLGCWAKDDDNGYRYVGLAANGNKQAKVEGDWSDQSFITLKVG